MSLNSLSSLGFMVLRPSGEASTSDAAEWHRTRVNCNQPCNRILLVANSGHADQTGPVRHVPWVWQVLRGRYWPVLLLYFVAVLMALPCGRSGGLPTRGVVRRSTLVRLWSPRPGASIVTTARRAEHRSARVSPRQLPRRALAVVHGLLVYRSRKAPPMTRKGPLNLVDLRRFEPLTSSIPWSPVSDSVRATVRRSSMEQGDSEDLVQTVCDGLVGVETGVPLPNFSQARQTAYQLGHARASLTQDVYMGRKAKNPAAADALETIADDL